MMLITFQDGKPVMRDGKVGTEQECCCEPPCCVQLLTFQNVLAAYTEGYENCWKPMTQEIQSRLQAAGWTVTLNETPTTDEFGEPMIAFSLQIEPCCGLSCQEIVDSIEGPDANGAYSVASGDGWVDTQSFELFDTECGFINFGEISVGGCCGLFTQVNPNLSSLKVSFAGGVGDGNSAWIPVCNPLP